MVLLTSVLPTSRTLKMDGAFTSYQSLRVNGSMIFFLVPFLPTFRPYNEGNGEKVRNEKGTLEHSCPIEINIITELWSYSC